MAFRGENFQVASVGDLGLGSRDFNSDGQLIRRDKLCAEIIDGWGLEFAEIYVNEMFYQIRPDVHILRIRHYLSWFTKLDACLILTHGHDNDLCSRIALLYLEVWNCCYHFKPAYHVFNRMQELGLCSGKLNVYYLFRIAPKQLQNVYFPGRPMCIDYHRNGEMEICHQFYQAVGLESLYSAGSDSVNIWRITSLNLSFERKVFCFKPIWSRMACFEDAMRIISSYIIIPIHDVPLLLRPQFSLILDRPQLVTIQQRNEYLELLNVNQRNKLPITHHEIQNAQDFRDSFFNELFDHYLSVYGPDRGYPRLSLDLNNFQAVHYGGTLIQFQGIGLEYFAELEFHYKLFNIVGRIPHHQSFTGYNVYPENIQWLYRKGIVIELKYKYL